MLSSSKEVADILVRVGQGDREAFDTLYRSTSRKLYGTILRVVSNRSLADDLLQEVFVKVWQRAADFDSTKASPITWMTVIARNRAIDEVRRVGAPPMDDIDASTNIAADLDHPLDAEERSDGYRAVLRCLGNLDPARRDLILLAYYRGMSRDALAARFNSPTATIKTWLHRSLTQLKQCLAA